MTARTNLSNSLLRAGLRGSEDVRIFFLIVLLTIVLAFLALSCQKAKEPEGKKEFQVKDEAIPIKVISNAAESKGVVPQITQVEEFKEPVLLWEREFDPPIIDISDQNSVGEYIAIQGDKDAEKPTKMLFLNDKGETIKEIPLSGKMKRNIPPEQVWLTYYGEEYREDKFNRSFKKGKDIMTEVYKAFVSGNGEYYGIITRDTQFIEPEYHSPWYEFAYYDKTGKLLWKTVPDVNYGLSVAHISHDGNRVILIDEANLDYFGQKWYLYDEKGNLLTSEDHLLKTPGTQEEWDKEKAEWIMEKYTVDISPSTRFIASVHGENWTNSKISLKDKDGKTLWSKKFDKGGHHNVKVSDQGYLIIRGEKEIYLANNEGIVIFAIEKNPIAFPNFSKDGNFILTRWEEGNEEGLKMYETTSGRLIFEIKASELFDNRKILLFSPTHLFGKYLIFVFSYGKEGSGSIGVIDIESKQVVWKKEKIGISSIKRLKNLEQLLTWGMKLRKVVVFKILKKKSMGYEN